MHRLFLVRCYTEEVVNVNNENVSALWHEIIPINPGIAYSVGATRNNAPRNSSVFKNYLTLKDHPVNCTSREFKLNDGNLSETFFNLNYNVLDYPLAGKDGLGCELQYMQVLRNYLDSFGDKVALSKLLRDIETNVVYLSNLVYKNDSKFRELFNGDPKSTETLRPLSKVDVREIFDGKEKGLENLSTGAPAVHTKLFNVERRYARSKMLYIYDIITASYRKYVREKFPIGMGNDMMLNGMLALVNAQLNMHTLSLIVLAFMNKMYKKMILYWDILLGRNSITTLMDFPLELLLLNRYKDCKINTSESTDVKLVINVTTTLAQKESIAYTLVQFDNVKCMMTYIHDNEYVLVRRMTKLDDKYIVLFSAEKDTKTYSTVVYDDVSPVSLGIVQSAVNNNPIPILRKREVQASKQVYSLMKQINAIIDKAQPIFNGEILNEDDALEIVEDILITCPMLLHVVNVLDDNKYILPLLNWLLQPLDSKLSCYFKSYLNGDTNTNVLCDNLLIASFYYGKHVPDYKFNYNLIFKHD